MYVRFRVSSSTADGRGMRGLVEVIRNVATASAGASISTPGGCTYFQVVSNTDAGGWTVKDSISETYSYSDFRGYIEIENNTNKSGYTKAFRVDAVAPNSQPTYWGAMQATFKAYDNSNSRYSSVLAYASGASSSTSYHRWMPNLGLYNSSLTWHFSCTADYVYLWYELDGGQSSSYSQNFAGVSELNNVPDSYLETGNAFFPAVGFYGSSNNSSYAYGTSTTSSYHDYFAHTIHGAYDDADDSPFDYLNNNNIQYSGTGGVTVDNAPIQFGPFYYENTSNAENTSYNYKPVYNGVGEKVGSMTPVFYFNPYRGIPFTTLNGFYYYEPFERFANSFSSLPSKTRQSEIIFDAAGDKYTLQYQVNHYTIRAFRSE